MKAITEKEWYTATNGLGNPATAAIQTFEVEQIDVGTTRQNRRGQNHSSHTFTLADVGRQIHVYTDHFNWTCWNWKETRNGKSSA